ncbi:tripartite tricarboxylate transporter substrate binding protein [Pigmentiphaga sp. NML080357]|uniref:Bug family tripartite tricarboxylate transporter substrate binding protein n=1 Tax=Pigmentiphaga sp. NML080357 TaxID=2008675 RepID=UPI00130314D9|nr:tripartite tricarboxylate transporter substrate binding protein [Pigmentiphaga sp. NML080357]
MRVTVAVAALAAVLAGFPAWAKYPERPIRLIVPYPAGGTTDVLARLVAKDMAEALGQEVFVENRAGAATIVGVDAAARAPSDGYTILLATATSFAVNPHIYKKLPYRLDEFIPIGFIGEAPILLVSPVAYPARNLTELIGRLKADGAGAAIATTGKGGFSHLTAAMFFNAIGAKYRDVPYRGEAPAIQDVVGGQVNLYFGSMPGTLPHVSSGRLRAYGVTSEQRSPSAPGIPSFAEQGLPQVVATSWFGLSAPKGTPQDVIATLGVALAKAMKEKSMRDRLAQEGAVTREMSPAEFADYIRRDNERWGAIVRAAGVEAE